MARDVLDARRGAQAMGFHGAAPRAAAQRDDVDSYARARSKLPDDRPIEQILRELARPWNAIVVREADGTLTGTGPFRVARWEAGKAATLVANEAHWKGRPYLDSVEIQMGRDLRDQTQDLQLGKADVTGRFCRAR